MQTVSKYPQAATMAEAKRRWRSHTRRVLSDEALAAFNAGERWNESSDGYPCIISADGLFMFSFERNERGHVWAHCMARPAFPYGPSRKMKTVTV